MPKLMRYKVFVKKQQKEKPMKQLKRTVLILLLAIGMTLGMVPLAAAPVHAVETKDAVEEDAPAAPDTTEIQEAPAAEGKNDAGNTGVVNETPDENALKLNVSEAESYSLWVGGVQVTDANKGNIPVERGSASYDNGTKTLTLNGADIDEGGSGINSRIDSLTIKLEGTNNVRCYGNPCINSIGSLIITGSGTLNVRAPKHHAINVSGDLTVSGGEVTATTTASLYKAVTATNILINGGKLTARAGGSNSNAVHAVYVNVSSGELDAATNASNGNAVYADNVDISGGTVTASASGHHVAAVQGIYGVSVSGGTVTLEATGQESYGIKTLRDITIEGGTKLTALGQTQAIYGTVKNHIAGKGWNDNYGSGYDIPVKTGGQSLSYKKVKFPDKVLYNIKSVTNRYVQVLTDPKETAYSGQTVTVKAWPKGSFSPAVYVKKASNGSIVQEVELTFNDQTFIGTFTMPDHNVIVEGDTRGAGEGRIYDSGTVSASDLQKGDIIAAEAGITGSEKDSVVLKEYGYLDRYDDGYYGICDESVSLFFLDHNKYWTYDNKTTYFLAYPLGSDEVVYYCHFGPAANDDPVSAWEVVDVETVNGGVKVTLAGYAGILPLKTGENKNIIFGEEGRHSYSFTPAENGIYRFRSKSDSYNTQGVLKKGDETIAEARPEERDFSFDCDLTAGTTYTLNTICGEGDPISGYVYVEKISHIVTTKDVTYLRISADKKYASKGQTVTVSAWTEGAYSPIIYVKTSDGSIVQEVTMTASGQGFKGTFTMPDYDVTVTGKAGGAGDGGDEDKDSTKDSGSGKSASSKSPNTDDEQNAAGWITMMITSASALAALVIKRKGILHR